MGYSDRIRKLRPGVTNAAPRFFFCVASSSFASVSHYPTHPAAFPRRRSLLSSTSQTHQSAPSRRQPLSPARLTRPCIPAIATPARHASCARVFHLALLRVSVCTSNTRPPHLFPSYLPCVSAHFLMRIPVRASRTDSCAWRTGRKFARASVYSLRTAALTSLTSHRAVFFVSTM